MVEKPSITLVHLYPKSMNIYGDTGNVATIKNRLERRGFRAVVVGVDIGDELPESTDIIIAGGGQDDGQLKVADDLQTKKQTLLALRDDGVPMLVICGAYQLFGHWFKTNQDISILGIGLFDMTTTAGPKRLIGNLTATSEFGDVVGFENHSGETVLSEGQKPLGTVTKGAGNNATSSDEGAVSNNAIGSYCHGPMLPKNPAIADTLIRAALVRRGYHVELEQLDDSLAEKAAKTAASRPR